MKKAREKTQAHAMKQFTRKGGVESRTSSSTPIQIKVDSDEKERSDKQSQLNREHIDEDNVVESKRRKVSEQAEQSEHSASSDSSEADWSD